MNIQNNLQNILDKFPKNKVELATHEVNLGKIQDEIKQLVNNVKGADKELAFVEQDLMSAWLDYDEVRNSIDGLKKKLKEAKGTASARADFFDFSKDIKELFAKMKKAASELGVKVDSIKDYKKLLQAEVQNQKQVKEVKQAVKKYNV
jgi:chromosome segregation ATPase